MFYHLFIEGLNGGPAILADLLGGDSPFRIFKYISFRMAMATLTALLITFLFSPWFIRQLRERQYGQAVRDDGPETHLKKAGTPTMGGGIILLSLILSTLLWSRLDNPFVLSCMGLSFFYGLIGFIDDYLKVSKKNSKGLKGSVKIVIETALALGFMFVLLTQTALGTDLSIPFIWNPIQEIPGWFAMCFGAFVIVGTANAVNLTDGADGLAIGPVMTSTFVYAILAYLAGNVVFSAYLHVPHVSGAGELTIFCGALFGSSLAFLWYNAHPASVFMGDLGSLSLGASLGGVAVSTKGELLMILVGGVFVLEALSVIIQVSVFKMTGKRVFRMAPYHHTLELKNRWAEQKMVVRLWIISIILALFGLATLKLKFNI